MTSRSHAASQPTGTGRSTGRPELGLVSREAYDLYCWGCGASGQLGNEVFRDEVQPYLVLRLRGFGGTLLVSCGFDQTCVVNGDLRARGWGRAQEGQLGVPPEERVENALGVGCVLEPSTPHVCRGEKPLSVQAIAAGGMHAALITLPRSSHDEPLLFTMGRGTEGQLGTAAPPTEVKEQAAETKEPAPGEETVQEKLRLDRAYNYQRPVPLPGGRVPILVACGGLHSALTTEHGQVFTWGHSAHGQTGQSTRAPVPQPRRLPSTVYEGRAEIEAPRPVVVSAAEEGGRTFHLKGQPGTPLQISCLSCGYHHTAACSIEGDLFVWGQNADGQLGLADTHDRGFPHLVRGFGGESAAGLVLQVACGGRHTLVLTQRGAAWSFGCNAHRQLGRHDAHGVGALEPRPVGALAATRLVQVACGGAHSVALGADGSCHAWGKNQNGQLGLGHSDSVEGPTLVASLPPRAAWVSCGGAHTAALVRLL
jgi:alpha-tubulin suppressor-like RCC1 family protein